MSRGINSIDLLRQAQLYLFGNLLANYMLNIFLQVLNVVLTGLFLGFLQNADLFHHLRFHELTLLLLAFLDVYNMLYNLLLSRFYFLNFVLPDL